MQEAGDAGEAFFFVLPIAQVDELLVGAQAQRAGVFLDQLDKAARIGEPIAAQRDDGALWAGL